MAGGGGTRFWPWSREAQPKQILPIVSDRSMIWETVQRISPFIPPENVFIVTSRTQVKKLHREVPQIPPKNLLTEPMGRNTAPCICLAALHIQKLDPAAVMVVLPADHHIGDPKVFLRTLKAASAFARKRDLLVTLGIHPTEPETGYGYIQKGVPLGKEGTISIFRARAFREKPSRPKARAYLKSGDYLWNSGMFVWRVEIFLGALQKYLPDLYAEMAKIHSSLGTPREKKALETAYARIEPVSIDYGIMEKAQNVAVVDARFPWNDVGSWAALGKIWPMDERGNATAGPKPSGPAKVLAIDSSGCLIHGREKLIAVIGLKDMVVVESGDAFLVCPRDRCQDVRQILKALEEKGWKEYL